MRFLVHALFLSGLLPIGVALAAPVQFDLPAQPAAPALIAFARQAEVEILFASAELGKVSAADVHGSYEPEQALALLLAGTGFTASRDAAGKFVVIAAAKPTTADAGKADVPSSRIVELPPLTVSAATEEQPWSYLEIPGYEILARCRTPAVVRWANEVERLHRWLAVMLPEEFRIKRETPTTVILYDIENRPEISPEVVKDMLRKSGTTDGKTIAYRSLPNMRLADPDAMGFFFILDPSVFGTVGGDALGGPLLPFAKDRTPGGAKLKLAEEYVHYLAQSRSPASPDWFVEGVVDLFETADFNGDENAVVLAPITWGSAARTMEIRKSAVAAAYGIHLDEEKDKLQLPGGQMPGSQADAVQLPPLAELFAMTRRPDRDEVLRNEAVLFLRWGLDGKNAPRREALWKFLRRASAESATETLFRECFGFGYAEARRQLGEYFLTALTKTLRLVPAEKAPLPPLRLQPATRLEIARIKGDWDRLEIGYVKSHFPELTTRYVEQTRRTLHRAYDQGERDPRLLAIMGLCECDAGDDAAARPYLEAAVQGGVIRPRAYYELARLRYVEARSKAEAPGGKLSPAQATAVLHPLARARGQQPPLLESYALTAEVWARTDLALTRRELDVLAEGVGFFPWNAPFIYQVAWLNAQHGFTSEARALIDRGLKATANPALVARFEQLRTALAIPSPTMAIPR
jgi:hypothetical protein